ncbi:unnamed protein product, partial [marine sediment metagenome]
MPAYFNDDEQLAVTSITPEVQAGLDSVGMGHERFNYMHWPVGAGSHAHGRFLMHGGRLASYQGGATPFLFGTINFDRVYIRNPRPLFVSEGSGAMFVVDVVDERFFWKQNPVTDTDALNLSLTNTTELYDASTPGSTQALTASEAVEYLINRLGADP